MHTYQLVKNQTLLRDIQCYTQVKKNFAFQGTLMREHMVQNGSFFFIHFHLEHPSE